MNDSFNYIKSTFLQLTKKTYPYGYEDDLILEMGDMFPKLDKDVHGNYLFKLGESRTIFASHLDTACKDQVDVKHVIKGNVIETDKKSVLGADDKAGVTILLWLIKNNIPGLYYFFFGEEVGCIGSGLASKLTEIKGEYDRIISFDRRGTDSVITYQSSMRCCSDEFADELSKQLSTNKLKYRKDTTGIYTDSAEFTSVIPECTNISVGYYSEHTVSERQDINHLYLLANSCLNVNWESLPTKRDMNKLESKWEKWENKTYERTSTSKNWTNSSFDDYNSEDDYKAVTGRYDNNKYGNNYDPWNDYGVKKKRNRSRSKNIQKKFFDDGSNLIELKSNSYLAVKDKFLNISLSMDEIEIIKDQYLDMKNSDDRSCYEILKNSLIY